MVGVDRPIMALSMHIQKPYKGIIVKVLIAVILSNFFFLAKLHHAYGQCVLIVLAKYQIVPSKAKVGVYRLMKAPSMLIQKPY